MIVKENKIILFPKQKERVYVELTEAINDGNFALALQKVTQLIDYGELHEELIDINCYCLMQLEDYEELVGFSVLMKEVDDRLFEVCLGYYIEALYELEKYKEVIELYHEVEMDMADEKNLDIFYDLALQMNAQKIERYMKQFNRAKLNQDHQESYRLMNLLLESLTAPIPYIEKQLTLPNVHPLVKTAIIDFYREKELSKLLEVEKFELTSQFEVESLVDVHNESSFLALIEQFDYLLHKDPAKYNLYVQLMTQYFKIMYPFTVSDEDLPVVKVVFEQIVEQGFGNAVETAHLDQDKVTTYMENIHFCINLYMSIKEIY